MIYKKASSDVIYIMLTIMILAVLLPIFNLFMGSLNETLQDSTDNTAAKEQVNTLTTGYINSSDIIFATIFFALYLGAIVLSYFLDTHPMFIVSGIVVLIIMCWIAMLFADSFMEISSGDGALAGEMVNFPMLSFIMTWFAELSIGLVVIVLIVLYRKNTG